MKIVFFGTANVALPILEELNTHHEVLAVVTNPDAVVGRKKVVEESPASALARDLKLLTMKPEKVKGNAQFLEQLKQLNADIFVVVAYGKILPLEIINLPRLKTVNVHFSVLPAYRGPSPIQFALLNGESQTGTSVFVLDEHMDTGPLLAQKVVNVDPDDNYFTLSDKLAKLSAHLLVDTLEDYRQGRAVPLPQDESRATYSKIIAKQDGKIDWDKNAQEIFNQFRAFFIWPGIWTEWNGKKLKVLDCVPVADASGAAPGTVLPEGRVVCGGSTALELRSVKPEGKNDMAVSDFLNGYKDFTGSKLS